MLDGIYANYAVAKSFSLAEKTSLDVSGMLGYMGSAQSEFYFGHRKSGLSDASLTAGVSYAFDDNTTLFVSGTAVTVPDSDLGDSLDALGFDDSGFYFAVGASWSL
ncbi:MAG: hypothetical protein L6Q99_04075 [Planctomycetes bacterium]|nr:hypothetical protein [Planctomycetota bacterium]